MSVPNSDSTKQEALSTPPTSINDGAPFQPIKGLKLAILLGSITLVTFLALLDTAIVGTVRPFTSRFRFLF
jgi:hypothetical protein